ncbi:MAG: PAS domain S-box protein, partial [Candidatus Omnitrophota bacterium]
MSDKTKEELIEEIRLLKNRAAEFDKLAGELRKKEESLRRSEEEYRSIVDNIGIGVSLISPEMEILSMNNQMRKWNPHVDVKDKPICYRCFNNPPREGVCSYCPTIKTLKDGLVHEDVTKTPMGDEIYNYRIISSPIKDSTGKVVAAVEMVEDITERKRTDERLRDYAVRLGYLTKYANDFIILLDENFRFLETNE